MLFRKRVHEAVLRAFGKEKIAAFRRTHPGKDYVVDHVDSIITHNCCANLRPAASLTDDLDRDDGESSFLDTCQFCGFDRSQEDVWQQQQERKKKLAKVKSGSMAKMLFG